MADQHYEYRKEETRSSGVSTLAFVVGGLVALVGVLAYIIFGGDFDVTGGGSAPSNVEINATVDGASGSDAPAAGAGGTDGADAGAGAAVGTE
jgi:hypothetical protein